MKPPTLKRLASGLESRLRRHCEAQYPNEACGAIFGDGDGRVAAWRVSEVLEAPNTHDEDQRRRYLVPPDFQLRAERHAHATGQSVIGYYHSHPDHPARPSEYDRAHAWFGYLYLICSVHKGRSTELNAFTLEEEPGAAFLDVSIDEAPAPTA